MLDVLLRTLATDPDPHLDVAEVLLYLATDEYPTLDVAACLQQLDDLADDAQALCYGTWEDRVIGLCHFLFEEQGFTGNTDDYYDPRNSYFNEVLERRVGLPITLSVLAMSVGARVGLDIVGVGLPGHFIVKAIDGAEELLFDPFHDGQLLSPEACEHLVQAVTGQPITLGPNDFAATPPRLLVLRWLNNLKNLYAQHNDARRLARILQRQLQLQPQDMNLRRDLGLALVRADQPGVALAHLRAYLHAAPFAPDADEVRRLVEQARRDLARWN